MRTSKDKAKKKEKNVSHDEVRGKLGMIYIPEQKIGQVPFPDKSKGLKRKWKEAKLNKGSASKKKKNSE